MRHLTLICLLAFGVTLSPAQVTVPNPGKVLTVNAPDVTITSINRVSGKNELKVMIANKGKVAATNVKLKVYALPFAYCSSQSIYMPHIDVSNYPCVKKPFEIPLGMRFQSVEGVKYRTGLAWTAVSDPAFNIAAGAAAERVLKFPAEPIIAAGETPQEVFPIPWFHDSLMSKSYLFAARSTLKFDLSVFYAVLETDGEVDKTNNEYFFNIRQRG